MSKWHAMMKSNNSSRRVVRALVPWFSGAVNEKSLSRREGFSGGATKAMEKSAEQFGDEGVTTIAGSADFTPICESETSFVTSDFQWMAAIGGSKYTPSGAGMRIKSGRCRGSRWRRVPR